MSILKILLLVFSTLGLWELVRRSFPRADVSFVPGITVAAQVTLLFLAGLLNLLREALLLFTAAGLISLGMYSYRDKGIRFLREYLKPAFFFLAFCLLVMSFFLRDKVLTHFDSFSHWGLVVKNMLATGRFPNHLDTVIRFQEYPLGSAVWIWYFCKLAGTAENVQMFAQLFMLLVSIMPLFSLCKKGWPLALVLILTFTNYVLICNALVTDLLVDTLLPLVFAAGLLYVLQYRPAAAGPDSVRSLFPAAFCMIQLTQVKNSGLFLAAVIAVVLLFQASREKKLLPSLVCVLSPLASFWLWYRHCQYAFTSAAVSKHAMTAVNFTGTFRSKSPEDIRLIFRSLVDFVLTWKETWLTLGVLAVAAVLVFFFDRSGKSGRKKAFGLLLLAFLLFVVYQVGLFGMYVFSMPGSEATGLAGFARYERTILIAMAYLALVPVLRMISENWQSENQLSENQSSGKRLLPGRAAALLVAGVMTFCVFGHMVSSRGRVILAPVDLNGYSAERRGWVEQAKSDYSLPDGGSYAVLTSKENVNYLTYICRYVFLSSDVTAVAVESEYDLDKLSAAFILNFDRDNPVVRGWLSLLYPEQADSAVIFASRDDD